VARGLTLVPRWITPLLVTLAALALVPFACVARARVTRSPLPRLHVAPDMDNQGRFESQQANPWFADGRAMRPPVAGTVARESLDDDEVYTRGYVGQAWATAFPDRLTVDERLLARGRERYAVFCSPCHGLSGYGDGMVARRADQLQQGGFTVPSSFHAEPVSSRPVGHLFNTISHGIRTMPAYGSQIPVADRWAIVAYVRALQRSQHASIDDVPPAEREKLR
jgi:mono/diheme cytochrome c family protein